MVEARPKARITTAGTRTMVNVSCLLRQIVILCSNAGTTFTLQVQDKAGSPNIIVAAFTLTVPSDGKPTIIKFEHSIPMDSGIDVVTTGTPGAVNVWLDVRKAETTPA